MPFSFKYNNHTNCIKKHGGCASCERADGEKEEVSTEQGRIQISIIGCSTNKKQDFVGKIPKCKELKLIRVGQRLSF